MLKLFGYAEAGAFGYSFHIRKLKCGRISAWAARSSHRKQSKFARSERSALSATVMLVATYFGQTK